MHVPAFNPLYLVFGLLLAIWTFFWKGFALWRAARCGQVPWFIGFMILLLVNDAGIIEILYLFRYAKKRLTVAEIRSWKNISFKIQ